MKKILSVLLVSLMILSLGTAVMAAGNTPEADRGKIAFEVEGIADGVEWEPDGILSEGEYGLIDVQDGWISTAYAQDGDASAAKNLDFILAMSWDEDYIYTYVEFEDANGHDNTYDAEPGSMWKAGCLQVNYADATADGTDRLEYGIGISNSGKKLTNVWAEKSYKPSNDDFEVFVDDDLIVYEFRTPIDGFSKVAAEEGAKYGVCLVLSWGNGGDHIHTQIASGCTGDAGKDAGNFAKITLGAQMEVIEEVEEAPAASAATFDASIIALAAAVLSGAGVVVSKKRK